MIVSCIRMFNCKSIKLVILAYDISPVVYLVTGQPVVYPLRTSLLTSQQTDPYLTLIHLISQRFPVYNPAPQI